MNADPKTVSVIVPCFNEVDTIGSLLSAIAGQDFPMDDLEIVIADGMSDDGTRGVIESYAAEHPQISIRLVDNHERIIPAGLNKAIEVSNGDYVIRLDAHSRPNPDYISRCVRILESSDVANVGGAWEIEPGGEGCFARGIAAAAAHPLGAGGARYRVGGPPGRVETVPFGAFKRSWMERVGRFDETLLTNEDYEYNVRIRDLGGEIFFDPSVRSVYLARNSLTALARQYTRYGFWKAQMLRSHPGSIRLRQIVPPLFIGSLLILLPMAIISAAARVLLAFELALYFGVLIASGVIEAFKRRRLSVVASFPLAVAVIHFSWGGAFLWSIARQIIGVRKPRKR